MPSKSKKDKRKEDHCLYCGKVILEQLGAWIHSDTGKSEGSYPVPHAAYPKSRKKG